MFHPQQYFIICENRKVLEVDTFFRAVIGLTSIFYIMDMVYPAEAYNVYIYIEAVLFGNKQSLTSLSGAAVQTLNSIEKM